MTGVLDDAAALLDTHLRTELTAAAHTAKVKLSFFDEATVLRATAEQRFDDVSRVRIGDAMWRDAHHPRGWVHRDLATAAAALLRRDE